MAELVSMQTHGRVRLHWPLSSFRRENVPWDDHTPELCPSQSSCRKRKRSQVNSSSCMTFSPGQREETHTHTHTHTHTYIDGHTCRHTYAQAHSRYAQTLTREHGHVQTHASMHTHSDLQTHTQKVRVDNIQGRNKRQEGGEWKSIKKRWC